MSDVSVNTVRPATTARVNFQGLQVPTYLNDPIITLGTLNSGIISSPDPLNSYGGVTVQDQLQEIANGLKLLVPGDTSTNMEALIKAFYRVSCPIGKVVMGYWSPSFDSLPGLVPLDGRVISRTGIYVDLWNWVTVRAPSLLITDAAWLAASPMVGFFSSGDGSTTFRVPDLRGAFIRGNPGSSIIYAGESQGLGVDAGRALASKQLDDIKAHTHTLPTESGGAGNFASLVDTAGTDESPTGNLTGSTGGTETRPVNISLGFFMYY